MGFNEFLGQVDEEGRAFQMHVVSMPRTPGIGVGMQNDALGM